MHGECIFIDEAILRRNVLAFLRSPAAESVYEELEIPWWLCVIGAMIMLIAGLCMLPTIVWTLAGLQVLWSVVRLEQFQPLWNHPRKNPEALIPLICAGIIIGPDGKHALALGTFLPPSKYSMDWLAKKALAFGDLYIAGEAETPADEPLLKLLQDDTYRPSRRRPVPEPHAEGAPLLLLDVEVSAQEGRETPYDVVLFAFVAEPSRKVDDGEKGDIVNIPWAVVNEAVQVIS
jgi:hypothetical protein